jgi:23S rRNA (guanosine2251-2'-O)-methyltransferase
VKHHKPSRRPERSRDYWLYGLHAARAALDNRRRKVKRAVLTARAKDELAPALGAVPVEIASLEAVGRLLPSGAVHQGAALLVEPLPQLDLETALANARLPRVVAVLDQVTDPHNEGAILRSASAFGIAAVVVQDRHSPEESGALAKAASGALDMVPRIVATNIARALEELGDMGFWRIALAGDGETKLTDATRPGDIALVLGAEGAGVRRLVRERCDIGAVIPMPGNMESLNVSNAAAIAFYELTRR